MLFYAVVPSPFYIRIPSGYSARWASSPPVWRTSHFTTPMPNIHNAYPAQFLCPYPVFIPTPFARPPSSSFRPYIPEPLRTRATHFAAPRHELNSSYLRPHQTRQHVPIPQAASRSQHKPRSSAYSWRPHNPFKKHVRFADEYCRSD